LFELWLSGGVALAVAAVAVLASVRLLRPVDQMVPPTPMNRRIRVALAAGVGTGLLVAIIVAITRTVSDVVDWPPDYFAFGQAYSPLAGATVALFVLLIVRRDDTLPPAIRTADLGNRRRRLIEWRDFLHLGVALVILCLVLVTLGAGMVGAGETYSSSLYILDAGRSNEGEGFSPLFSVTVIAGGIALSLFLGVVVYWLRNDPGSGNASQQEADHLARREIARTAIAITVAAIGLAAASILWHTGAVTWSASFFPVIGNCHALDAHSSMCSQIGMNFAEPAHLVGMAEIVAGMLGFSVSTLTLVRLVRGRR
jgi:hypothetical protein